MRGVSSRPVTLWSRGASLRPYTAQTASEDSGEYRLQIQTKSLGYNLASKLKLYSERALGKRAQ